MQAQTTFTTTDPEAGPTRRIAPQPRELAARELAAREADGIHVLLLWHPREDAVTVSVEDSRAGQRFDLEVARDRALEAFYHPFAYAATQASTTTTHHAQIGRH